MRPILREVVTSQTPESVFEKISRQPGAVLLRGASFDPARARYSFLASKPFLTFQSFAARCELRSPGRAIADVQFGNPWRLLDLLMARYEMLDEMDLPFPTGGCFGFWGYDLKNFVEPRLARRALNDLDLPDCCVGFYDSLLIWDHLAGKTWIISTGMELDGTRNPAKALKKAEYWRQKLQSPCAPEPESFRAFAPNPANPLRASLTRPVFIERVLRAKQFIGLGHIYQVNLAQRLTFDAALNPWRFYQRLASVSPSPFSAYLNCGSFQIASSSPELFLRLSGSHIETRPIKGTRPRSPDPNRDAQLTYELQTSAKEIAELVMITDLLRNDLGKICEFGAVRVPELVRLERFSHVQHLVSTVEGRLRPDVTHFAALSSCFPGGSITGAPKFRAMEIIDELEPVTRGPYTGALGYLGFNRESQLSILIRAAVCLPHQIHFHAGAGIVTDSCPEAEYEETWAKARGFLEALALSPPEGAFLNHPPAPQAEHSSNP